MLSIYMLGCFAANTLGKGVVFKSTKFIDMDISFKNPGTKRTVTALPDLLKSRVLIFV